MYVEIIKNIEDLLEKMKREKNIYDEYLLSLEAYNVEKKKMESNKRTYHASAMVAEKATLYLKELVYKKKLNNDSLINKQIETYETESKTRLAKMSQDCTTYIASLEFVNGLRNDLNKKQSKLLKLYQYLEKEDKMLYSKIMEIIHTYQKKILDFSGEGYNRTEALIKNINIDRDISDVILELKGIERPEEEIPYVHYPTDIDFNKCNDARDFKVCNEIVKTMKKYHDRVFTSYDESLEEKKK
jgi:hypothetical protein